MIYFLWYSDVELDAMILALVKYIDTSVCYYIYFNFMAKQVFSWYHHYLARVSVAREPQKDDLPISNIFHHSFLDV